jgi:uncharacterized Zn finger protein
MARKKRYGQTWWGKRWLSNLLQLEYDRRRHKRGRSYASKGSVLKLDIHSTGITAQVQGSEGAVYEQYIQFERYSPAAQQHILKALQENGYNLAALSNGQFTRALERDLETAGVLVFPRAPLDIHCSCPDGAIACKHLMAVFYRAANRIDRQPDLLFYSRGLDIKTALLPLASPLGQAPPQLLDLHGTFAQAENTPQELPQLLPPNNYAALLSLLPDSKLIYVESDFEDILEVLYERLEQHLVQQQQQLLGEYKAPAHEQLQRSEAVGLEVDAKGQLAHIFLRKQGHITVLQHPDQKPLAALLALLKTTENSNLAQYPPTWQHLVHSYRLAQQLALTGYVWPQLVQVGTHHTIAWRALEGVALVRDTQQRLLSEWPEHLLALEKEPLSKTTQLPLFWHWCWQQWITDAAERWRQPKREEDAAVWATFVQATPVDFSGPTTQGLPAALQNWLAPLACTQARYWPLLQTEQAGNGYLLTLKWRDQQDRSQPPILWEDFITANSYQTHWRAAKQTIYTLSQQLALLEDLLKNPQSSTVFCGTALYEALQSNLWPKWQQLGIEIIETIPMQNS